MGLLFPSLERFYLHPTDTSGNIEVDFSKFPKSVKWVAFSEVTDVREGPPARVSRVRSIKSLYCLENFYGATEVFVVSDSNGDSRYYDEGSGLGGLADIEERPHRTGDAQCPVETKGFPQVMHLCNNINSPTFCNYKVAESGQTLKPADASGTFMSCASSCPSAQKWLSCVLGSEYSRPENCGRIS